MKPLPFQDRLDLPVTKRLRLRAELAAKEGTGVYAIPNMLQAQQFFRSNPTSQECFLFFDGRMLDADTYRAKMISRIAQLVAIATDGFPLLVSRQSVALWERVNLHD
jgi:hypothetical protein